MSCVRGGARCWVSEGGVRLVGEVREAASAWTLRCCVVVTTENVQ